MRARLLSRHASRTPWMLLTVAIGVLILIFLIFMVALGLIWLAAWIAQGTWVPHPAG